VGRYDNFGAGRVKMFLQIADAGCSEESVQYVFTLLPAKRDDRIAYFLPLYFLENTTRLRA